MNTKISYLYRDASNYKIQNECIVRGLLTDAQIKAILDCRDGDNFIPSQVGLPEKRFDRFDPEEDTCWFELDESGFFSQVKKLAPHDLDFQRRFAGRAAFHDGQTGKEWIQKARDGKLRPDLSDIIAKAQKTFEGIAKGDSQQPQKTPER